MLKSDFSQWPKTLYHTKVYEINTFPFFSFLVLCCKVVHIWLCLLILFLLITDADAGRRRRRRRRRRIGSSSSSGSSGSSSSSGEFN